MLYFARVSAFVGILAVGEWGECYTAVMYNEQYKKEGLCERCGNLLTGKSERWCSGNCGKLGLKRLSKKRNAQKQREYRRNYKKAVSGKVMRPINHKTKAKIMDGAVCNRCGSIEKLNCHHIKPRRQGGTHERSNLMALCFKCHMEWERRMAGYWK